MTTSIEENDRQVAHERKIAALEAKDLELVELSINELYAELGQRRESMNTAQLHEAGRIIAEIDEQVRRASELLLFVDGSQPL